MGREGTSQPSCFCSLLLFLFSLTIPPSLCLSSLSLSVFFFHPSLYLFFYCRGRLLLLLLWDRPIQTQQRPRSATLVNCRRRRLSVLLLPSVLPRPWIPTLSGSFLIPRLITNTLSRAFPDADDSFVAVKLSRKT